jgi:4-oxalocrotonate tautomerase
VPFINVKLIEGVFDASQKQQIIRDLTNAMVAIEGENMRPVTWCVVEEVSSGDWGIAGNPLTTEDVRHLPPERQSARDTGSERCLPKVQGPVAR